MLVLPNNVLLHQLDYFSAANVKLLLQYLVTCQTPLVTLFFSKKPLITWKHASYSSQQAAGPVKGASLIPKHLQADTLSSPARQLLLATARPLDCAQMNLAFVCLLSATFAYQKLG